MPNHHKSALRRSFEFIAIKARGFAEATATALDRRFGVAQNISPSPLSPAALQIATRWAAWNSAN